MQQEECSEACWFQDPQKKRSAQEDVLEPMPLAMIPASPFTSAPVPYLTKEVIEGIATGFLHIHPSDVSATILQKDVNDN